MVLKSFNHYWLNILINVIKIIKFFKQINWNSANFIFIINYKFISLIIYLFLQNLQN